MNISEQIVLKFIENNFDASSAKFLNDSKYDTFLELVRDDKEIAAAEEYQKVTAASTEECRLAATFAKTQV